MKTYTAYSRDIAADINSAVKGKGTSLKSCMLEVHLTMEEAGYKKIVKNPQWMQKCNEAAKEPVAKAVKEIARNINELKNPTVKDIDEIIEKDGAKAGDETAAAVNKALKEWLKDGQEYTSYKVKHAGKILVGVGSITVAVVSVVGSHGATTPVAVITIVRSGMQIAQAVTTLALEAEGIERLIRADFLVLTKAFAKSKDDPRWKNNLKEGGLGLIAGILGVDTPSLANAGKRIEVYGNKITGLSRKTSDLSKEIGKVIDLQDKYIQKIDKYKDEEYNKKDKQAKIEMYSKKLKAAENGLNKLLEEVHHILERVDTAEKRHKFYEKYLAFLKEGVSGWTQFVQSVTGLTIDLALVAGHTEAIEKGLEALLKLLEKAEEEMLEKI